MALAIGFSLFRIVAYQLGEAFRFPANPEPGSQAMMSLEAQVRAVHHVQQLRGGGFGGIIANAHCLAFGVRLRLAHSFTPFQGGNDMQHSKTAEQARDMNAGNAQSASGRIAQWIIVPMRFHRMTSQNLLIGANLLMLR